MDSYIEIDIIIKDTHGGSSSLGSKQSQPTQENGRQIYSSVFPYVWKGEGEGRGKEVTEMY